MSGHTGECACNFVHQHPSLDGNLEKGEELLQLQSRHLQLQADVAELIKKSHHFDPTSSSPKEHDVEDHLSTKKCNQHSQKRGSSATKQAPLKSYRRGVCTVPVCAALATQPNHRLQDFNSNALEESEGIEPSALSCRGVAGGASTGTIDLRDIREEISLLRRKFDEELHNMQSVLHDNRMEIARLFEAPKSSSESKENAAPPSGSPVLSTKRTLEGTHGFPSSPPPPPPQILTDAQQVLTDATRRRKVFDHAVANFERDRQQNDIFDILETLGQLGDDEDNDVLRIKALLDDAVKDLETKPNSHKSPILAASSSNARANRLSVPKQARAAAPSKNSQLKPTARGNVALGGKASLSKRRPTSMPPPATNDAPARSRGTSLAELVDFSTNQRAPPLMQQTKVVLPSLPEVLPPPTPAAPPNPPTSAKYVRFKGDRSKARSPRPPTSAVAVQQPPTRGSLKKPPTFLPLGMRQYTAWPPPDRTDIPPPTVPPPPPITTTGIGVSAESVRRQLEEGMLARILQQLSSLNASLRPSSTEAVATLSPDVLKELLNEALRGHVTEAARPKTPPTSKPPPRRCINVGTSPPTSLEESSRLPPSPADIVLIERAASAEPIPHSPSKESVGISVQSKQPIRSPSLPSFTPEAAAPLRLKAISPIRASPRDKQSGLVRVTVCLNFVANFAPISEVTGIFCYLWPVIACFLTITVQIHQ
uniref:Protein phosphatase 1 regulatory subunit 15A n=1 Tax=Mesocestoides corti TaxID=53468 RepID=A0A5K3F297_MESCO